MTMQNEEEKIIELEKLLNRGSMPSFILQTIAIKGEVGRQSQFKFVVNTDDHRPPHLHVSVNNKQLASYNLLTREKYRSDNPRLDKIVLEWLRKDENQTAALNEWQRCHGAI